jgi:hypothetical protein
LKAVRRRRLRGALTGVTLIDKGDFDRRASRILNLLGQFRYLCPVLFVSR